MYFWIWFCIFFNFKHFKCDWLLNDRRPKYEDLQRGLKMDTSIYKAVTNNPIVQFGLIKPKVFFGKYFKIKNKIASNCFFLFSRKSIFATNRRTQQHRTLAKWSWSFPRYLSNFSHLSFRKILCWWFMPWFRWWL